MPKKKAERVAPKKSRTRDPMQDQTPTARKRAAKAKGYASPTDRAQCTAHKRNGDRCSNPPVRGAKVCRMHGGSAPQVRAKANQRLIEMVLPAMKELHRILNARDTSDADKLKAINMVLNRTGYSERQQIDIGLREPTPFDNLTNDAFVIMRGRENVIDPADEPEALAPGDGSGGGVDEDLEAFLDQRERARQREATTRIDNTGHDVVPGDVAQRPAADPFRREERRREEWERSATEYDPRAPKDDPQRDYEERLIENIEETERRTGRKR